MPVVFVSHASADDPDASVLETWLHANGFTDLYVDHTSMAAGENSARGLARLGREPAASCCAW